MSQARIDAAGLVYTIDLGALARNWSELAARCRPAECSAVVKADAYGLGIEAAVPALWGGRLPDLLRRGAAGRLSRSPSRSGQHDLCPEQLRPSLGGGVPQARPQASARSFPAIEAWAKHAPGEPSAIQVDTGMNRLGLSLHEALSLRAVRTFSTRHRRG